jgi:hypothetical protein
MELPRASMALTSVRALFMYLLMCSWKVRVQSKKKPRYSDHSTSPAITALRSSSPLTINSEGSTNPSSTGMDEHCVNRLESDFALLQQMVDTQTTTLGTIQQQLSLLANLSVPNPPQPTTATPCQTVDPPLEQPLPPRPVAQPT